MPDPESEPNGTDASDSSDDSESDASDSYPDDARSPLARWSRRVIRARLDPRQTALPKWDGRESTPADGSALVNRAVRTVLSPRVVVAVALVVDLSLRTLVDVGPIATTFVELLAPVVSLSANTVTPTAVGRLTTWLVLLGVLYAIAPRLFPRAVRSKLDTVGFRLLFVGIAAMLGVIFDILNTNSNLDIIWVVIHGFGMISTVVVTASYFRLRQNWNLLDPEGDGVLFLDQILIEDMVAERRSDRERTGPIGVFTDAVWVAAVGLMIWLPAFVAGALMSGFLEIQPLPDLLAVGVLVSGLVGSRSESGWLVTANLEERLLSNVREATRTFKGGILSGLLAVSAIPTARLLAVGITPNLFQLVTTAVGAGRVGVSGAFGTAWIAAGVAVCVLVGTLHLLWVLARLFRRLPPFLAVWRGADEVPSVPVARPPGWIIPGFLALATGGGCLLLLPGLSLPTVAWLWPLGIVPALLAPFFARRRDAGLNGTVPETENRYLVVSASLLLLLLTTGAEVVVRLGEGQPLTLAALDGNTGTMLTLWPVLVSSGFLPDVGRYATRHDDIRQYTHAVCLAAMGLWLAVLGVGFELSSAPVLRLVGGGILAGAVVVAVIKFVEGQT